MPAEKLAYEDFQPGRRFPLGPKAVTAPEIIEFAAEFDPQPMHLDETAGRAEPLAAAFADGRAVTIAGRDHMSAVGDKNTRQAVLNFFQ